MDRIIDRQGFVSQPDLVPVLGFEVRNLLNNKNAQIINPVTGRAYEFGDPLPVSDRDPNYPDPTNNGIPPFDPARYMQPTQFFVNVSYAF